MDRRSKRVFKLFAIMSACALIVTRAHAGSGVAYQINEETLNVDGDTTTAVARTTAVVSPMTIGPYRLVRNVGAGQAAHPGRPLSAREGV